MIQLFFIFSGNINPNLVLSQNLHKGREPKKMSNKYTIKFRNSFHCIIWGNIGRNLVQMFYGAVVQNISFKVQSAHDQVTN